MKVFAALLAIVIACLTTLAQALIHHGNSSGVCQTLGTLVCDANGWTQFSVGPGGFVEGKTACSGAAANVTCIFYVNTGGSDANDCTFTAPCLTPETTANSLRNGSPDWLLMAKGQTWTNHSPVPNNSRGGLNANNPMLVSSYDPGAGHNPPVPNPSSGGASPQFIINGGWYGLGNGFALGTAGGGGGSHGDNLAWVGLSFYACSRDPNASLCAFSSTDSQALENGLSVIFTTSGLLIEDCTFSFFSNNGIAKYGDNYTFPTNIFVRRSRFLSTYSATSNVNQAQGLVIDPMIGGPSATLIYESLFDHNGWICPTTPCTVNGQTFTSWGGQSALNHNMYFSDINVHGDVSTLGGPWTASGNIFSNDGASTQFRLLGVYQGNLFINNPNDMGLGMRVKSGFAGTMTGNVAVNGLSTTQADPLLLNTVAREFDGTQMVLNSTLNFSGNLMVNTPAAPTTGVGIKLGDGYNGATVTGNVLYNCCINNAASALTFSSGGLMTQTITAQGSGYTDKSMAITSAQSSTTNGIDAQGYIVAIVANSAPVSMLGSVMYQVGANAVQGPFPAFVIDSTHIEIFGTSFAAAPPAANSNASFTGTLYYPYYQQNMTGGSGTGAQMDIFSVGGHIVAANNGGSDTSSVALDAPGKNYLVNDVLSSAIPGGTGFQITLNSVSSVTVASAGCNLAINNIVDPSGANPNSCTYADAGRTAGSYYSTLAGSTANATFTGVVANGVLTVSGISGTLNLGDAVTWAGQTNQDYIKFNSISSGTPCNGVACTGNGGNGTYALTGINTTVGSQSMKGWTAQQLINSMRAQSKSNWNTNLTACAVNKYIKAGFGITDTCNVNQ